MVLALTAAPFTDQLGVAVAVAVGGGVVVDVAAALDGAALGRRCCWRL